VIRILDWPRRGGDLGNFQDARRIMGSTTITTGLIRTERRLSIKPALDNTAPGETFTCEANR
jgi:hypothetical protein